MNRLVALHSRTLASYLTYASPTWHRGDERPREVLADISSQQRETVDRLGSWVVEHNGIVNHGSYPMVFTAYHDLSFEFLLDKLVDLQQEYIETIESCVADLDDPIARELAQEALGEAKAHYDALVELQSHASPAG